MEDPSLISITTNFDPRLALLVGWVTLITKTLVDWIKTVKTLPTYAPPALAFAGAWSLMVLLMLALGIPATVQLVAQATICALIATVLAVGQTALQSRGKVSTDSITEDAIRIRAERLAREHADRPTPIREVGRG